MNLMETINQLPYFDLKNINESSFIAIVGQRHCGKTQMIETLLSNVMYYDDVYRANGLYDTGSNIEKNIGDVLKTTEINTIVLDDAIIGTNSWKNFQKLMSNGRHYKKNVIIGLQSLIDLPPAYRKNLHYIFVRCGSPFDRKRIYEYIECNDNNNLTWEKYNEIIDQVWNEPDYQWIVIDNTKKEENENPKLYYYSKTEPQPTVVVEKTASDSNASMIDVIWNWMTWQ